MLPQVYSLTSFGLLFLIYINLTILNVIIYILTQKILYFYLEESENGPVFESKL